MYRKEIQLKFLPELRIEQVCPATKRKQPQQYCRLYLKVWNSQICVNRNSHIFIATHSVCPRSVDPFHAVTYYTKLAKTSWKYSMTLNLFYFWKPGYWGILSLLTMRSRIHSCWLPAWVFFCLTSSASSLRPISEPSACLQSKLSTLTTFIFYCIFYTEKGLH